MQTVVRDLYEELGLAVAPMLLEYVLKTTNKAEWTTYLYALHLEQKPELAVLPESAGTVWVDENVLKALALPLFADHNSLALHALHLLDGLE